MPHSTLEILLRLAGLILTGLIAANFVAAKRFSYAANLTTTTTIVRQIFNVHCAYIISIISGLALLCLGWPQLLMTPGMGKAVGGFFAIFWFSRVVVQLTYYDPALRGENRFWDVFFLVVFFTLGLIFTLTTYFA